MVYNRAYSFYSLFPGKAPGYPKMTVGAAVETIDHSIHVDTFQVFRIERFIFSDSEIFKQFWQPSYGNNICIHNVRFFAVRGARTRTMVVGIMGGCRIDCLAM